MVKAFFSSVFTKEVKYQMMSAISIKDRRVDTQSIAGKEEVRDYLDKLDIFKSAGPDELRPRVLEELA